MGEEKAAKTLAYIKKNLRQPSTIVKHGDYSKAIFSRTMISKKNIIEKTKHQCSIKHNMTTPMKMISPVAIKYLTHLVMISGNSLFRKGER